MKYDGQPGRGMGGRDGQKMSPVSQGCAVKRLLNCRSSILGDKTFCERWEFPTDSGVRESWGLQDCCKGRLKRTDTYRTKGKGLKTEMKLCMLQGNGKIGAEALSPPSLSSVVPAAK